MKLVVLAFLLVTAGGPAWADKLMEEPVREVPSAAQPQSSNQTEQIIDILLSQGVAGVGLIVLAWWIKTTTTQARADRIRIEERVFNLVEKTNSQLAEQHGELTNISRELERLRA